MFETKLSAQTSAYPSPCKALLLFLLTGTSLCFGQKEEESFDYYANEVPLVVSASLIEESIDTAPSTMTVFTQTQLRRLGVDTLADALARVVDSSLSEDFFGSLNVRFRGVPTINVMLDGHPVFTPFNNEMAPWANMGIDHIDRIEIIRGPGSALYGTNAFGGVVNVITIAAPKAGGTQTGQAGQLGASLGSFDTYRGTASWKAGTRDIEWKTGVDLLDSDGPDDLILERDSISPHPSGLTPGSLKKSKKREEIFMTGKTNNWVLAARYAKITKPFLVGTDTTLVNEDQRQESHWFLDGAHTWEWDEKNKVEARAYWDQFDTFWDSQIFPRGFFIPYDLNGDGQIELFPDGGLAKTDMSYRKSGAKLTCFKTFRETDHFVGGLFYENQEQSDYSLKATFNPVIPYPFGRWRDITETAPSFLSATRDVMGLFLQQSFSLSDTVSFLAGGRYDHYSDFGSTLNPRLAAVWTVNRGNVFKLMYGKAFRAPNFLELYTVNNPVAVGNPNLGPEIVHSTELSWEYFPNDNVKCHFNLFYNDMSDLIGIGNQLVPVGFASLYAFTFDNKASVVSYGGEAECSVQYDQWEPYLRLAWVSAEDQETHIKAFNVPEHQEEVGVNTYLGTWAYWNIQVAHSAKRPSGFSGSPETDGFFTLNSTLYFPSLWQEMNLSLSLKNILDEEYEIPSGSQQLTPFPQIGRSVTAKAVWQF